MTMIITADTLKKMDLCGNHHAKNAIKFVGELREITPGNILCALEQGVDVSYFVDYWLREDAGKGLGIGPKGKIPDHWLWIHEELMEELNAIYKESHNPKPGFRWVGQDGRQNAARAMTYYRALECMWMNKRWAL